MLDWFRRVRGVRPRQYASSVEQCDFEGHLAINNIDSWFCPLCRSGFFTGMQHPLADDFWEDVQRGVFHYTQSSWHYGRNAESFTENVREGLVDLATVLESGRNVEGHRNGGPPYVFEIR